MIDQLAGLSDLARVLPRTHGQRRSLRRAAHGAAFCIMFQASAAIRPQSAVGFGATFIPVVFTWQLAPRGNGGLVAPAAPGLVVAFATLAVLRPSVVQTPTANPIVAALARDPVTMHLS